MIIRALILATLLMFAFPEGVCAPMVNNTDEGEPTHLPTTNSNPPSEPEQPEVKPVSKSPNPKPKTYTFIITFYTELEGEGGGITASGKKVAYGMVANNQLPFGTKIQLEGMGTFIVEDRGSSKHFNQVERVDMYIPRQKGESNDTYKKRVSAMGVKKIKGTILD